MNDIACESEQNDPSKSNIDRMGQMLKKNLKMMKEELRNYKKMKKKEKGEGEECLLF